MKTSTFQNRASVDMKLSETGAARQTRIAHEAGLIAAAEAEISAGLGIDDAALGTWLNELEHDNNAPVPVPVALKQ